MLLDNVGDPNITKVLEKLDLAKYQRVFDQHEIEYEVFLNLNKEELKELNIPIGPAAKLIKEIEDIRENLDNKDSKQTRIDAKFFTYYNITNNTHLNNYSLRFILMFS